MPLFGSSKRGRSVLSYGPRVALTAAAVEADRQESENIGRLHQPWQARAFSFYNRMGECWNPAQFVARALSKARLYAAIPDPDEKGEWKELESGWAFDLVQQWEGIPEPYGRLRSLIGEGRLTQSLPPDADDSATAVWEFLSPTELTLIENESRIQRLVGAERIVYKNLSKVDGAGDPAPGEMRMWRFHRPHPENSGMADSSFRGVLDLYEQLWWLTLSERADLRNRAANQGILLVPEEIDFEEDGAEEQQEAGDDPAMDPFQRRLQEMLSAALSDPGSAQAASPGVVRGPAEMLDPNKFRHIRFHDPSSSLYASERERALILRISIGLDLPVDEVMGIAALNHWNAWKLDDDKFAHVQPEGEALARDLTEGVLRPIGRASREPDAEIVQVFIDWAELVSDPDRGKTAVILHAAGAIGDEALREANDFDETDAMTPEERQEWLAIQLKDGTLIGGAPDGGVTPAQNEEPPAEPAAPAADAKQATIILAARDARQAAGKWVLGKRRSCPDCFTGTAGVKADRIIAALGAANVAALGENEAALAARMRDRFYDSAAALGWTPPVEAAADIEMHFAHTLYEAEPNEAALAAKIGG